MSSTTWRAGLKHVSSTLCNGAAQAPFSFMHWHTTRFRVDLSQPRVMGIVNLTPDSFSDGGRLADTRTALAHAQRLLREGADLLDLGAESSRPGAPPVSAVEEWCRLEPVLREALHWGVPLSVDTCKVEVMRRALDLGVDVINDIQALRAPGAEELLASHPDAGVVLMHMQGEPSTMQGLTQYRDVAQDVAAFLHARADRLTSLGVRRERIVLDPGYGFAKTAAWWPPSPRIRPARICCACTTWPPPSRGCVSGRP